MEDPHIGRNHLLGDVAPEVSHRSPWTLEQNRKAFSGEATTGTIQAGRSPV